MEGGVGIMSGRDVPSCSRETNVASGQKMTTLMVRNIPRKYTQEMLLEEWPNLGTYDLLFSPSTPRGEGRGTNYVFVNFTSEAAAQEFRRVWDRKRLSRFPGSRALTISFAVTQGRDKYFENINSSGRQPLIFDV